MFGDEVRRKPFLRWVTTSPGVLNITNKQRTKQLTEWTVFNFKQYEILIYVNIILKTKICVRRFDNDLLVYNKQKKKPREKQQRSWPTAAHATKPTRVAERGTRHGKNNNNNNNENT